MTAEKIQRKARELRAKTRRELLVNIAVPLMVAGFSGLGIARAHDPVQLAVFAFAIVWALVGQYVIHRGMWAATLPGDAALSTGLEFYRREIERRRYLFRRALQWSFGPLVFAIGAFILRIMKIAIRDRVPLRNAMPFTVLVVIWIAAYFVVRMRGQRELQREIDELNDIERENR